MTDPLAATWEAAMAALEESRVIATSWGEAGGEYGDDDALFLYLACGDAVMICAHPRRDEDRPFERGAELRTQVIKDLQPDFDEEES